MPTAAATTSERLRPFPEPPACAGPQPRTRRTSRERRSRSKHRYRARHGPSAGVAGDPSPWSRQARRPAREDSPVSSRSSAATPSGVRLRSDTGPPRTDVQKTGVQPRCRERYPPAPSRRAPSRSSSSAWSESSSSRSSRRSIVVGDTWLTLMAGREVVENGLPHTEHLTVLGEGRTWTDQQWLAQVVFYAAHGLAGMRAVILLGIALRPARARPLLRDRAGRRRVVPLDLRRRLPRDPRRPLGLDAPRADGGPRLFAACLWLLVDASRNGTRRRTLLVLPLLVLWANLHGSVVLGAGLAVLLGLVELVRARRLAVDPAGARRPLPLCVLATPYGWDIVAYYKLMLVDAPFAPILREWQWSSPSGTTALFWLLALVAAGAPRPPALPDTPDLLRARRPRGDLRWRGAGRPRRDLVRARRRRDPPGRPRRPPDEGGHRGAEAQPDHLAGRARRPRGRDARRSSRAPRRGSSPSGPRPASPPYARRRATRTSASGRPTAPPTGSSGASPTSAAASPTTSVSSSTTSRPSTGSFVTGAAGAMADAARRLWRRRGRPTCATRRVPHRAGRTNRAHGQRGRDRRARALSTAPRVRRRPALRPDTTAGACANMRRCRPRASRPLAAVSHSGDGGRP